MSAAAAAAALCCCWRCVTTGVVCGAAASGNYVWNDPTVSQTHSRHGNELAGAWAK